MWGGGDVQSLIKFSMVSKTANIIKCLVMMYECQEVSNSAIHNFPRPEAFKEETRNENQDQRKIFCPGEI